MPHHRKARQDVQVDIRMPDKVSSASKAIVQIFLEDVSEEDARAQVIASTIIPDAPVTPDGRLTAVVSVPRDAIDPRRSYNVRVHVRRGATGDIKSGDLVSTQSAPVLTHGYPERAAVALREVK